MADGTESNGPAADAPAEAAALRRWLDRHARWFVLTGAGCSTESGIPDYRATDGSWKRKPPVTQQEFTRDPRVRARYWARGLVGWRHFVRAQPNAAHRALARLEQEGRFTSLVTQNVDGLHQAAGSRNVIDLHGRLDQVLCLACGARVGRAAWQRTLEAHNPDWAARFAGSGAGEGAPRPAPDGDADLDALDFSTFDVPTCETCGGTMKPDVVFFGDSVPRPRIDAALQALDDADAMLVVGSSLMVYSGFRYAQAAAARGVPIVAVNLGRTRADHLLAHKIELRCSLALGRI
jgi:NAD-dependent SIR2 family protein deacetylase